MLAEDLLSSWKSIYFIFDLFEVAREKKAQKDNPG